jgi:plastocyanin
MRRIVSFRPLVVGAGASLALGLAACGNGAPASSGSGSGGGCTAGKAGVSLGTAQAKVAGTDNLQFAPTSSSVKSGQIVEWDNTGTVLHNITFDAQSCLTDSSFQPGGKWQIQFTAAGTYPYHCTIHPGMDGSITVS